MNDEASVPLNHNITHHIWPTNIIPIFLNVKRAKATKKCIFPNAEEVFACLDTRKKDLFYSLPFIVETENIVYPTQTAKIENDFYETN